MAAKDSISRIQFRYSPYKQQGSLSGYAEINAIDANTGKKIGNIAWGEEQLENVSINEPYQRQGVATEMWMRAQQAAKEQPFHYPQPRHSQARTKEGDRWAWSLYNRGLSERPKPNDEDWETDEGQ